MLLFRFRGIFGGVQLHGEVVAVFIRLVVFPYEDVNVNVLVAVGLFKRRVFEPGIFKDLREVN